MDVQQMLQRMQAARGGGAGPQPDQPLPDTAEKIQISSLSLLKMLKHGRAGVPMEVMGLMLGQFVDDYTITCVDVFAMPQVREMSCCSSFLHSLNLTASLLHPRLAWYWCLSGSRRPRFPDQHARYVEANRKARNGCGVVSLPSRLRCLDVWC